MNQINHHLSDETLAEYASGALTDALEVVVACHLTLCPSCRERAEFADEMGGYFIDSAEAATPTLSANEMLNKIRATPPAANTESMSTTQITEQAKSAAYMAGIPAPLAKRLTKNFDDLPWKWMAKGIHSYNLHEGKKSDGAFKLLKIQPGTELIEHSHGGHELTLILHGSYTDAYGHFGVGDIADFGPDDTHKPVIDSSEPCIALIASNSPARFKGLVGKMIQPFVDI